MNRKYITVSKYISYFIVQATQAIIGNLKKTQTGMSAEPNDTLLGGNHSRSILAEITNRYNVIN